MGLIGCLLSLSVGSAAPERHNSGAAGGLVSPSAQLILPASSRTYTTNFPLSEDPISEGSNWINGGTHADSTLWGNVQTTPGLAFGVNEPTRFGDPTAVLSGN